MLMVYGTVGLAAAGIAEGRVLLGLISGGSNGTRFYFGGARFAEALAIRWNENRTLLEGQELNRLFLELLAEQEAD